MAVPAVSSEASQALHLVIQDSCRGKEEGKIGDRGTETRRFRYDYLFHVYSITLTLILSHRRLLSALALLSLSAHTHCWLLGISVLRKRLFFRTDVPSSQHKDRLALF